MAPVLAQHPRGNNNNRQSAPGIFTIGCDVGCPGRQHLEPLAAERQFFKALLEADGPELDRVLADDFLLIDVLSGSEFQKPTLIAAVASCQVKFEKIDVLGSRVRRYRESPLSPAAHKCAAISRITLLCQQPLRACVHRTAGPLAPGHRTRHSDYFINRSAPGLTIER